MHFLSKLFISAGSKRNVLLRRLREPASHQSLPHSTAFDAKRHLARPNLDLDLGPVTLSTTYMGPLYTPIDPRP